MDKLQTLGDVLTLVAALFAIFFVPYVIIRAWAGTHIRTVWTWIVRAFKYVGSLLSPYFMSSEEGEADENISSDLRSQQQNGNGSHSIAMGNNAVNQEVTVNSGDAGAGALGLSAEGLEAVQFRAKAEAVAELLRDGLITNQAKAIETVFHCSRTSSKRPDTPYQKAKHLVDELVSPRPVFYNDLRAKIEEEVLAEAKR